MGKEAVFGAPLAQDKPHDDAKEVHSEDPEDWEAQEWLGVHAGEAGRQVRHDVLEGQRLGVHVRVERVTQRFQVASHVLDFLFNS